MATAPQSEPARHEFSFSVDSAAFESFWETYGAKVRTLRVQGRSLVEWVKEIIDDEADDLEGVDIAVTEAKVQQAIEGARTLIDLSDTLTDGGRREHDTLPYDLARPLESDLATSEAQELLLGGINSTKDDHGEWAANATTDELIRMFRRASGDVQASMRGNMLPVLEARLGKDTDTGWNIFQVFIAMTQEPYATPDLLGKLSTLMRSQRKVTYSDTSFTEAVFEFLRQNPVPTERTPEIVEALADTLGRIPGENLGDVLHGIGRTAHNHPKDERVLRAIETVVAYLEGQSVLFEDDLTEELVTAIGRKRMLEIDNSDQRLVQLELRSKGLTRKERATYEKMLEERAGRADLGDLEGLTE